VGMYERNRRATGDNKIRRKRVACWMTGATDIHLRIFNTVFPRRRSLYISSYLKRLSYEVVDSHGKRVHVTTTSNLLSLRMQESSPARKVAANVLNKQSRTAEKEWSSSLGFAQGGNDFSTYKCIMLQAITKSCRLEISLS